MLPGGLVRNRAPFAKIAVMTNRSNTASITEWCLRTGRSWHDLQMSDFAFMVDRSPNGDYQVQFIKCRDRDRVISWCCQQWGESSKAGRWYLVPSESYSPRMFIHDESDVTLFKMVWE